METRVKCRVPCRGISNILVGMLHAMAEVFHETSVTVQHVPHEDDAHMAQTRPGNNHSGDNMLEVGA